MDITKLALRDLKQDERFLMVVRHHWFILAKDVFGVLVLFFIPFIVVPLAGLYISQAGFPAAKLGAVFGFLGSAWALICWQILFVKWTDYYYDVWIVTNFRIIDIDQQGLFKRNVASILNLDHIQDIDYELHGVLGNLLNFGHFSVQTAGSRNEFDFDNASSPAYIERVIRDAQEELLKIKGHEHL